MRNLILLLAVLALSGCASVSWEKKGVSELQKKKDTYSCEKDARQSGYFGGGLAGLEEAQGFFQRCMESKEYKKIVEPVREIKWGGIQP